MGNRTDMKILETWELKGVKEVFYPLDKVLAYMAVKQVDGKSDDSSKLALITRQPNAGRAFLGEIDPVRMIFKAYEPDLPSLYAAPNGRIDYMDIPEEHFNQLNEFEDIRDLLGLELKELY